MIPVCTVIPYTSRAFVVEEKDRHRVNSLRSFPNAGRDGLFPRTSASEYLKALGRIRYAAGLYSLALTEPPELESRPCGHDPFRGMRNLKSIAKGPRSPARSRKKQRKIVAFWDPKKTDDLLAFSKPFGPPFSRRRASVHARASTGPRAPPPGSRSLHRRRRA
jgi:hypothetical protein